MNNEEKLQSDGQTADPRNRSSAHGEEQQQESGEKKNSASEQSEAAPNKEGGGNRGAGTSYAPGEGTANMGSGVGGIGGDHEGEEGTPKRGL